MKLGAFGVCLVSMLAFGCVSKGPLGIATNSMATHCKPQQACWPTEEDWKNLSTRLTGKLEIPQSPLVPCRADAMSEACKLALQNLKNPFFISDHSGGTQSLGWHGAWSAKESAYALAAETANDIAEAVKFAREHNLKLVIKATGHDYLGRSNAPDSFLIWTYKMRNVFVHKEFLPSNSPNSYKSIPAVTVEAGARWLEAYREVVVKNKRYVQGGGCTSVGAAGGFLQGGGFGSWSKGFGTAAANLVEAEVVVADGRTLIANEFQNEDLFWALRGGGGGTFGIVTKATMRTHKLPEYFGWVNGKITANSDEGYLSLLETFVRFYHRSLNNENWGEQVKIRPDNILELALAFQGLSEKQARKIWVPFLQELKSHPKKFNVEAQFLTVPSEKLWDYEFLREAAPGAIKTDDRSGQTENQFWWAGGDAEQVSVFWYAYESRYLPLRLFDDTNAVQFANVLFQASRHWPFGIHFNKGQSGASKDAVRLGRETSMHPELYNAAALLIAGANGNAFPGVSGHELSIADADAQKARVSSAMSIIREATPGAGTYANEADYFEENWQREFWGTNYDRLLAIKNKYDPNRTFNCHHCVGSE